ncbi:class I SAM-dependent methyltransferase [Gloeomargarita sp.]
MTLRLHIGGKHPHPDWKILDVEPRPEVDYVMNAADLSAFADESVDVIYSSHVLEHFHHTLNNELLRVLIEWRRVLKPGGKLLLSVPDLRILCWLYGHPNLLPEERMHLMRIIFGGQTNEYDVHKAGSDFDILAMYLEQAGFSSYEQVSEFNLFPDCSSMRILDTLISLNVVATR